MDAYIDILSVSQTLQVHFKVSMLVYRIRGEGVCSSWETRKLLGKKVCRVGPVVRRHYAWCLDIVVIYMGSGGAKT